MSGLLYAGIMASLLEDVRAGRLRAGSRVPSEMELAARFAVSRITSRRALVLLERVGIVERTRGRGTFIAASLPDLERARADLGLEAGLPGVRSGLIGLVLPDFSESYGLALVHGVEEACARHGHSLLLRRTGGERRAEEEAVTRMRDAGASALIVFPVHGEHYNPVLLQTVLDGFPTVLLDRFLRGIPAPSVTTDNVAAGRALAQHLTDLGHREIAFVSPPVADTTSLEDRLSGLQSALAEIGLREYGGQALQRLSSTLPLHFQPDNVAHDQALLRAFVAGTPGVTAFFVAEYNLALALVDSLGVLGLRVPEDVSVVCFDSPGDPFGRVPFTHIRQNQAAMGERAVELVQAKLRGETVPLRTFVDFELIPGHSSAVPRQEPQDVAPV